MWCRILTVSDSCSSLSDRRSQLCHRACDAACQSAPAVWLIECLSEWAAGQTRPLLAVCVCVCGVWQADWVVKSDLWGLNSRLQNDRAPLELTVALSKAMRKWVVEDWAALMEHVHEPVWKYVVHWRSLLQTGSIGYNNSGINSAYENSWCHFKSPRVQPIASC